MTSPRPPQGPPQTPLNAEAHRRRVLAIGALAAVVLLAAMVWLVQLLVEQQRMERCLASRRPDCFRIETPLPRGPVELGR